MVITPVVVEAGTDRPAVSVMEKSLGTTRAIFRSTAAEGATVAPGIRVRLDDEERWSEAEQKRFEELAIADAVGELTSDEGFELESLQAARRAHLHPRSGDEVLWEFRQRRLTSNLLETLRRYVEFYEGQDSAWFAPAQSSD